MWVVDVPGHYETVTETVTEEVWVEEQGHMEETEVPILTPQYTCNHCGTSLSSEAEAEAHSWDEFDRGNAGSYTFNGMVESGSTTERVWVVDVPAHTETVERQVETQVWVEEQGHWE